MIQNSRFDEPPGPLPQPMAQSDGTGKPLVKAGPFAADLVRFPPGGCVREHVHPGDHILIVVSGRGRVIYAGVPHQLSPSVCYLVPGSTPHAIQADPDCELTLISVANDHRPVASAERLTVTDGQPQ